VTLDLECFPAVRRLKRLLVLSMVWLLS